MNTSTVAQRLDAIGSLQLPDHEPKLRRQLLKRAQATVAAAKTEPSAAVVDGSLISFVANLPLQSQQDVLNSTLLAQLAANKQFDREKQTVEWYKFYRNVLENLGWVVQEFSFLKYHPSGNSFTVDQAVIKILEAIATGAEVAVVAATIGALKALGADSGPMVLWNSATSSVSAGNFQIGVANLSGGVVMLKIGAFYFTTTQTTDSFLWFSYSSSQMDLYHGGQPMNLNELVYAQVRQAVIDKLGDRATTFVADLPI